MTVTIKSNAIVEAAARALRDKVGSATFAGRTNLLPLSLDDIAEAVVAAVTPLIEANALRDALLAVEGCPPVDTDCEWIEKSVAIAALRAVLTKEQP